LGAKKCKELGVGIFSLTKEQLSNYGRKVGELHKKNGTGVCGFSKEQRQENVKRTNSQIWECTVTGYRTTSGPLTKYQNKRGIDISNRIRVK
jgi:ribosomal protein L37AE/L43A